MYPNIIINEGILNDLRLKQIKSQLSIFNSTVSIDF